MLNRKKAAQIAMVITGTIGISFSTDLSVIGLSASAKANAELTEMHTAAPSVTTETLSTQTAPSVLSSDSEQLNEYLITEESAVLQQNAVEQDIEQEITEEKADAIAEIIEAITIDSTYTNDAAERPDYLLDQLLANALNGHSPASHPQIPTAAALGTPISVGMATPTEQLASIDLATVAANINSAHNIALTEVPALREALTSENELTRLYAADTLWPLTGDADLILPTLVSAANSNNAETRELAFFAIAQLGQAAIPAVPILNDMVANSDDKTRQLAQDVLNVVISENRPATMLGILAREVQKLGGVPALFRALSRLW